MEPLPPKEPHPHPKTWITFVCLEMFCLTRNSISGQPDLKCQASSRLYITSLFLLTPNKVDTMAPAIEIVSIFLFLILYFYIL